MTEHDFKIIRHLPSGVSVPDDASMPYRVEINLRPPEFMAVAFIGLYGGSEDIIARCASRPAVDGFLDRNELRDHPRLRWIRITGPDGAVEQIGGRS